MCTVQCTVQYTFQMFFISMLEDDNSPSILWTALALQYMYLSKCILYTVDAYVNKTLSNFAAPPHCVSFNLIDLKSRQQASCTSQLSAAKKTDAIYLQFYIILSAKNFLGCQLLIFQKQLKTHIQNN